MTLAWKPNKPIRLRVKSDLRVKALRRVIKAYTRKEPAYNEVVERALEHGLSMLEALYRPAANADEQRSKAI